MTLRLFQLVTIVLFITLFIQSWGLRIVSAALLAVWLVIAILQIYYLSRLRRRYSNQQVSNEQAPRCTLLADR
jgi:O-antigen/teichoic acid export membrane protein